ncbi:unnamed protein product [Penicillium nalgiovense]|nr:unnamed protein product [Penicillium nalgiovense]
MTPSLHQSSFARLVLLPMGMLRRQKSAQKIRLEEEQRQLQASNIWLASDSDIPLQLCNVQASVLWDPKRAVQALCNGVVSALEASDLQA